MKFVKRAFKNIFKEDFPKIIKSDVTTQIINEVNFSKIYIFKYSFLCFAPTQS